MATTSQSINQSTNGSLTLDISHLSLFLLCSSLAHPLLILPSKDIIIIIIFQFPPLRSPRSLSSTSSTPITHHRLSPPITRSNTLTLRRSIPFPNFPPFARQGQCEPSLGQPTTSARPSLAATGCWEWSRSIVIDL